MNQRQAITLSRNEYGSGEPLVIVHGLLGSKDNWHSVAQRLSSDFRVIVPDLRNHGASPHADEMDFVDMAEDLHLMIDALGGAPVHLIGHSLGAKVILQYAMLYPRTVKKMILVDMTARRYESRHTAILEGLLSIPSGVFRKRSEADGLLAKKVPSPQVRAFLLKGMKRGEDGTLHWRMNVSVIARTYENLGRSVELSAQPDREILLLSGAKSDYVLSGDRESLRGYFPRLQAREFEQAGHWVHSDAREAFLAEVRRFLVR